MEWRRCVSAKYQRPDQHLPCHLPKESDATTSIYLRPMNPSICSEAVRRDRGRDVGNPQVSQRADIDQAVSGSAAVAKSIPSIQGRGRCEREEVRFLILSGLPHAEVVKRSGVSSGTVASSATRFVR